MESSQTEAGIESKLAKIYLKLSKIDSINQEDASWS